MSTVLFETLRVRGGRLPLLEQHVARHAASARASGLAAAGATLWHEVERAAAREGDAVIRAAWDGRAMDVAVRETGSTAPLALVTVAVPHPGYPHKQVERAAFDAALAAARAAGADEPLLTLADGTVAEAARFAIGWLDGEALVFPPLDGQLLPSIGRARVVAIAAALGWTLREDRVAVGSLAGLPLLAVNAARGVVAVASLNRNATPDDPRVAMLAERFWP